MIVNLVKRREGLSVGLIYEVTWRTSTKAGELWVDLVQAGSPIENSSIEGVLKLECFSDSGVSMWEVHGDRESPDVIDLTAEKVVLSSADKEKIDS